MGTVPKIGVIAPALAPSKEEITQTLRSGITRALSERLRTGKNTALLDRYLRLPVEA